MITAIRCTFGDRPHRADVYVRTRMHQINGNPDYWKGPKQAVCHEHEHLMVKMAERQGRRTVYKVGEVA